MRIKQKQKVGWSLAFCFFQQRCQYNTIHTVLPIHGSNMEWEVKEFVKGTLPNVQYISTLYIYIGILFLYQKVVFGVY